MTPADPQPDMNQRLTALEERLTHLEQQYDALNSVVLAGGRELEQVLRQLAANRAAIDRLEDDRGEDLHHEKPPHY